MAFPFDPDSDATPAHPGADAEWTIFFGSCDSDPDARPNPKRNRRRHPSIPHHQHPAR